MNKRSGKVSGLDGIYMRIAAGMNNMKLGATKL
jgi:hypothetical protein